MPVGKSSGSPPIYFPPKKANLEGKSHVGPKELGNLYTLPETNKDPENGGFQ